MQIKDIRDRFKDEIEIDGDKIIVNKSSLFNLFKYLKEAGYDHLSCITGIDYNDEFEIVYHLYSYSLKNLLTIKTRVNRKNPRLKSITKLYNSANWHEREIFDLLGIRFDGHPNMRRIFLSDTFKGHPLRKDYPADKEQEIDMEEEFESESAEEIEDAPEGSEILHINMGPQHPSTHGVLRLRLWVKGEKILKVYPVIGYLHRGIEKLAENITYKQFIPYTDRLDYVSSMINNMAYVLAVEKLMDIEVPERAEYLRIIAMELQRIASHLIWLGTWAMDIGAMTPFFYTFREREEITRIFEDLCGARLTYNYIRFGGVSSDIDDGLKDKIYKFTEIFPSRIDEYEDLLTDNEILKARSVGIGYLSKEDAINFGVTGPLLRASGVRFDLRKEHPYSLYKEMKFKVPVRNEGDVYARYLVRVEEMRQSNEIVRQALDNIREGDIRIKLPLNVTPQTGEAYSRVESPRGELCFYIVSDGSIKPYRVKIRSPAFSNLSALPYMCEGQKLADLVSINGCVDIVMGEIDR